MCTVAKGVGRKISREAGGGGGGTEKKPKKNYICPMFENPGGYGPPAPRCRRPWQ